MKSLFGLGWIGLLIRDCRRLAATCRSANSYRSPLPDKCGGLDLKTALKLLSLGGLLTFTGLPALAGPANDNFADRTMLAGTNLTVQGDNSGASSEPGEFTGGANVGYFYSVWYEWTAATNGTLYVSGDTSLYGFFMSVGCYRGDAINALTAVSTAPDGGIPVTVGDKIVIDVTSIYYVIWGGGGGQGPFTLTLTEAIPSPASANDAFANRSEITTPVYHFDGSIYDATSEPGEPLPSGTSQTLWWDFTPAGNGLLNLAISAAQFTSILTVYDGDQFSSMVPVS